LLVVYNVWVLRFEAYKVSVDQDGTMTFSLLLRRRVVTIGDVRRISRRSTEGGVSFKFLFTHGSVTMRSSRRVKAFITRLRELNPSIN
jgi:hypothetical protein